MIISKDICYSKTPHERSYLDIYLPEENPEQIYIYFHGGGIECGNKNFGCKEMLVNRKIAVVCPNYRLYPSAKFPDFIQDAAEAVAYVVNHSRLFGGCKNIFIGGSSAGAYLSMMLYFDDKYLGKYGLSCKDFSGFVFDAGQPTTHYRVLRERNIDTRRVIIDEASPIYHIKEYSGEPKMLIFNSDHDMANRQEQTALFRSTLKLFGYPDSFITYHIMENTTHCSYVTDEKYGKLTADFIKT